MVTTPLAAGLLAAGAAGAAAGAALGPAPASGTHTTSTQPCAVGAPTGAAWTSGQRRNASSRGTRCSVAAWWNSSCWAGKTAKASRCTRSATWRGATIASVDAPAGSVSPRLG